MELVTDALILRFKRTVRPLFWAVFALLAAWSGSEALGKEKKGPVKEQKAAEEVAGNDGGQREPLQPIKYTGIWLSGKGSEMDGRFPVGKRYALAAGTEGEDGGLSRELLAGLRAASKPNGRRLVDAIAPDDYAPSTTGGQAFVMACAINYEHVDSVEIGGVHKVLAEVGFDLVICDFSNRAIIATLPGRVMRLDVSKTPKVSEAQRRDCLKTLYRNELVKQFVKLAQARGPEMFGIGTVGVTKVTLMDEAKAVLPAFLKEGYEEFFSSVAASNFYEGVGLPMTPFSRGSDMVFCGMREGLSDAQKALAESETQAGGGLVFTLHPPDYEVELVIPTFRTVTASSNAAGQLVQNCCYSRISIKRGDLVVYSSQHDANVTNLVPKGSSLKVPWLAYSDGLHELFYKSSKQIKAQIAGPEKSQEKPVLIVKPKLLKQFFLECAPWSVVGNK
jgi:hypothetical protein